MGKRSSNFKILKSCFKVKVFIFATGFFYIRITLRNKMDVKYDKNNYKVFFVVFCIALFSGMSSPCGCMHQSVKLINFDVLFSPVKRDLLMCESFVCHLGFLDSNLFSNKLTVYLTIKRTISCTSPKIKPKHTKKLSPASHLGIGWLLTILRRNPAL